MRTVKNKNNIWKVMFLSVVSKPRYDGGGAITFDGRVSIWAFLQLIPGARRSQNRERGTLELKSERVTGEVMRKMICEKMIPAIQDKCSDEEYERTIFIQQDNTKPHVLPTDEIF